ncbi:MAG: hypothetical protein R3F60_03090 [bacterium]
MDESALIDWYDVVEAAANGRLAGEACPHCGQRRLAVVQRGSWMRVRCPDCGQGFEGRIGSGRDDAYHEEATALMQRHAAARRGDPAPAQAGPAPVEPAPPPPPPAPTREPWRWSLPADSGSDLDGLSLWMDVVQAVHNGRRTGLACPLCSEPLDDITVQDPHIRVRCRHCNEGFEGRIG